MSGRPRWAIVCKSAVSCDTNGKSISVNTYVDIHSLKESPKSINRNGYWLLLFLSFFRWNMAYLLESTKQFILQCSTERRRLLGLKMSRRVIGSISSEVLCLVFVSFMISSTRWKDKRPLFQKHQLILLLVLRGPQNVPRENFNSIYWSHGRERSINTIDSITRWGGKWKKRPVNKRRSWLRLGSSRRGRFNSQETTEKLSDVLPLILIFSPHSTARVLFRWFQIEMQKRMEKSLSNYSTLQRIKSVESPCTYTWLDAILGSCAVFSSTEEPSSSSSPLLLVWAKIKLKVSGTWSPLTRDHSH